MSDSYIYDVEQLLDSMIEHIERLRSDRRAAADQIDQLTAEIKGLRGLLRETPKHSMTEDLRRRVREALGDE